MTSLRIRVRESRVALPIDPGGSLGHLVVDVPQDPIKDDRGTVVFPWPTEGEHRCIVKIYGHMGIFNWLRKQVVGYRARREFRTLARLRSAGVDCCEPLFWGTGRSPAHGIFEAVATRELPGVVTLAERAPSLAATERTKMLGQLFEQLAGMHRAGVYHGAPYLTNVLLDSASESPDRLWMVDLEKSVCFSRDIRGSRMASYDLVSLVSSTFAIVGGGYARAALVRYGLGEAAIGRVFSDVETIRSSKFQRYRRRAEFLARGVLSRTWSGDRAVAAGGNDSVATSTERT